MSKAVDSEFSPPHTKAHKCPKCWREPLTVLVLPGRFYQVRCCGIWGPDSATENGAKFKWNQYLHDGGYAIPRMPQQ